MKAIGRRLVRLEQRFGLVEETRETKILRARLEAARLRCGLPPPSAERLVELRGMTIVGILNAARQRAANAHRERVSRTG
jgi:hypothetical protein